MLCAIKGSRKQALLHLEREYTFSHLDVEDHPKMVYW